MFKKLYYAVTGDPNEKVLKKYRPIVAQINDLEKTFERKSTDELRAMTQGFQARIAEATTELREALAEAEQEYLDVLGTEEQKFARVEVDRIKKELRKKRRKSSGRFCPKPSPPCAKPANAPPACVTTMCNYWAAWCSTAGASPR